MQFFKKSYVKNGIFEIKTILVKQFFFNKKLIKLKILHKKLQRLIYRKIEKQQIAFFFKKPYVKNGILERKAILVKHFLFKKKLFKLKILHKKLQRLIYRKI